MAQDAVYLRPETLDEAVAVLATQPLTVAAGCTDLFAATERKHLPGSILDISAIADLRGVSHSTDGVRIGATTTWSDVIAVDLPPAFDGLKLAAREVGARQIQNRGTIAGNLCNASPAADGVPPLLTLNAEVELTSVRGARRLSLAQFITGPRQTAKATDELVTALHIPLRACTGQGHFLKLGARDHLVISIAMVAARVLIDGGVVSDIALSIGACGPVATRLPALEAALVGQDVNRLLIDAALIDPALSPIDDMRADAGYRRAAAVELLRRVVLGAVPEGKAA